MPISVHAFAAQPPNYFPSMSCFFKAAQAQNFVLADDLQFTTHGEGNRMRIKTNEGAMWLTVPVLTKGKAGQLIKDVQIDHALNWRQKHWKTLRCHYGRAPYFEKYADHLEKIFRREWKYLADLNVVTFEFLHRELKLRCTWQRSSLWEISAGGADRIVEMGRRLGGKRYVTASANKKILHEEKFAEAGIALTYFDFAPRPYHQQYGAFVPNLTALDLLCNEGEDAQSFLAPHERI